MDLKEGIYEQLISTELNKELQNNKENIDIDTKKIEQEEAREILSKYLGDVAKKSLRIIKNLDLEKQIDICNNIIDYLSKAADDEDIKYDDINKNGELLLSVQSKKNKSRLKSNIRPITPISQSFLFTNSNNEPDLVGELKREILTSDSIDIIVSFIRWTGIRLIKDELIEHTKTKKLRIITTSYLGASEFKAIKFLSELPNTEIKISYDIERTRLHAKSYMFHRNTGFTTAYIGSSNISKDALTTGLEWNMKVSERDSKNIVDKFKATFESYFNDDEFRLFTPDEEDVLKTELERARYKCNQNINIDDIANIDVKPYHYQQEILENLQAERKILGHNKNLVVAATGVGKTVISAFDYKNFLKENKGKVNRLLFIAHREDILVQSMKTFRTILRDRNFGGLYTGNHTPENLDHVFMTIQTFNAKGFHEIQDRDFYDFIIVDEFHHASAKSYQKLLSHYKPKVLLGLTATPERMDGQNVLEYFDGRISAEMRLGEAIDRKLLSTFQYFCVSDELDLSSLKWSRGGYDIGELNNILTADTINAKRRADLVIRSINDYVSNIDEIVGLGFCVSIEHAKFMADYFNKRNIPSVAISSKCNPTEREEAKQGLIKGKYKFAFVVDLYNEGVDIPEINTILFLRPTESATVFLQQLGRGLRLSEGKECLTVLDYVGQAHKNYNFYEKFSTITKYKGKKLEDEMKSGFITLPKGCYIHMEKQAKEYILKNINAFINNKRNIQNKIKMFESDSGLDLTLTNFVNFYGVTLKEIYKTKNTFARLCANAGVIEDFNCPDEPALNRSIYKLTNVDSPRLLLFWKKILKQFKMSKYQNIDDLKITKDEETMLLMLYYILFVNAPKDLGINTINDFLIKMYSNRKIYDEIIEVIEYNLNNININPLKDELDYDSFMEVHCRYTLEQILCALGEDTIDKKISHREGVKYFEKLKTDVFFVTLNKTENNFSPSTMYEDYALNDELFNWQSQSKTKIQSKDGQRYINHKNTNNKILIFVRENKKEDGFTSPYIYLGQGEIESYHGNKPITIVWRLKNKMPAKIAVKAEKAL